MAFKVTYTQRFKKNYKKLADKEKEQFKRKMRLFVENPFHPSLRTKHIQGANLAWTWTYELYGFMKTTKW